MLSKVLIAGGIVGSASVGAGVGGYFLLRQSTIEELLSESDKKKTKLTIENKDKEWLEKWQGYVKVNTEGTKVKENDTLGIENWKNINGNKESVPEAFAQKCEDLLTTKVSGKQDPKYIGYITLCIK